MRSSDWLLPGPVSDDGRCIGAVCRAEFDQDEGLAAISKLSSVDDEATRVKFGILVAARESYPVAPC